MQIKNGILRKLIKLELRYENFELFILSFFLAYILLTPPYSLMIEDYIKSSIKWGYFGALIVGFGFAYGITTPVSVAALYIFGTTLNPFLIAPIAGLGATFSDYILFFTTRRFVGGEVRKIQIKHKKLLRFVKKFAPLIAMLIILSPFPDEIAAGFMGSIRYSKKKFIVLAYVANTIGILLVSGLGSYFG